MVTDCRSAAARSALHYQLPFGSVCRQSAAFGSGIDNIANTENCQETSGVQEVFTVLMPLLTPEADGCAGINMSLKKNNPKALMLITEIAGNTL